MHVEYIDGALVAVTLKLMNTIRTLPNVPIGMSIALMSPPTLPSLFQAGTEGADVAAAAPRHSRVICNRLEVPRDKLPGTTSHGRNIEAEIRICEDSPAFLLEIRS
jgi:hypothetical protein